MVKPIPRPSIASTAVKPSPKPSIASTDFSAKQEIVRAATRVESSRPESRLTIPSVPSSQSRAQESCGALSKIGEIAIECIPGGKACQILSNGGSIGDATKSLAVDAAITVAGVKLVQGGVKLAKVGRNFLKSEVEKGVEYMSKKLAAPKVAAPRLAFATEVPASRLAQVESKELPNVAFSKNIGKPGSGGGGGPKPAPKPEAPKPEVPKAERKGTTGDKEGTAGEKLKSVDSSEMKRKIGTVKKEAFGGGEMRTDGENLYRFDRAHQTGKIHLEKYEKSGKGWKSVAECDPETLTPIPGSEAKVIKRKPIKW
jgi:hypothetical protein